MARLIIWLIVVACGAVACGGKKAPVVQPPPRVEIVEVQVPVPVRIQPPPELLAPLKLLLPEFISPFDPRATSALTPEGERIYRALLAYLTGRDDAWRAHATQPVTEK